MRELLVEASFGLIPFGLVVMSAIALVLALFFAIKDRAFTNYGVPASNVARFKPVRRIAILIACKDGEQNIAETIKAAKRSRRQVFVVSDGSTDATARVARAAGAHVLQLRKNVGKPTALHRAYKHFELTRRFDAVAILDDDVLISNDFITNTRASMKPSTAISVGKNITLWPNDKRWNVWLAARAYSYWCYQLTTRRIQSSFNVMNCISGSNSLYRTSVLDKVLSKKTPYIVDDTYWTLETHRMHLGKIVFAPKAHAFIQDPTNFRDWYKQNLRWMWGTYQGILGHKIGTEASLFHVSYLLLITEWVFYVLSAPLLFVILISGGIEQLPMQIVILLAGYAVWVIAAAIALRKPMLVLFTPAVMIVDFLFRIVMVHALYKVYNQPTVESCVWNSPKRFAAKA